MHKMNHALDLCVHIVVKMPVDLSNYVQLFTSSDAGDGIFWLLGVDTMPVDALASKVARASAGMVLTV